MSDAREKAARAICLAGGNDDGGCGYTDDCPNGCRRDTMAPIAAAALTAALTIDEGDAEAAAMATSGYVNRRCGRVDSDEVIWAGLDELGRDWGRQSARAALAAFVARKMGK